MLGYLRYFVAGVFAVLLLALQPAMAAGLTVTLTSAFGSSGAFDRPLVLQAQISPPPASVFFGSCQIFQDGNLVQTGGLINGSTQFPIVNLSIGLHSFTATCDDGSGNTGNSPVVSYDVTKASPHLMLDPFQTTFYLGESILLRAGLGFNATSTNDTVQSFDGGVLLGTAHTHIGTAGVSFNTGGLSLGQHTITAVFSGNSQYLQESAPIPLTITVLPARAVTSTSLTISPSSATFGQNITLTATVSSTDVVSGSVTFWDGATYITQGFLSNGTVTITQPFAIGTHAITAKFTGSANFASSTSAPSTLTISSIATTTVLAASPNPVSFGAPVILTATVTESVSAKPLLLGSVNFFEGPTFLGSAFVIQGVATLNLTQLKSGLHHIEAIYPDPLVGITGSGASLDLTVVGGPDPVTTTVLSTSPNPSNFGQPTFLTVIVSANGSVPDGLIQFWDGPTQIAGVFMTGGTVSIPYPSLPVGQHQLTAHYLGSVTLNPSTSNAAVQTVVPVIVTATSTVLEITPNPANFADQQTLKITVTSAAGVPDGVVNVIYQGNIVQSFNLVNGVGQNNFPTYAVPAGQFSGVTAQYTGSANFNPSTSAPQTVIINKGATTITLAAQPNPIQAGSTVTFNANASFTGSGPQGLLTAYPLTGNIEFFDGTTSLGVVAIANGTATLNISTLPSGSRDLTAKYLGDNNYAASASAPTMQVVNPIATSVTLNSSANPSTYGTAVMFTAQAQSTLGTPTGTMEFFDGAASLGKFPLTAGIASFKSAALSVGTHNLIAQYSGDTKFSPMVSSVLVQTVNAPPESALLDQAQDRGSRAEAQTSTEFMTDSIAEEVGAGFGDTLLSFDANERQVSFSIDPSQPLSGPRVQPTADVPNTDVKWRLWTRFKYSDWRGALLNGGQGNGMMGITARLDPTLVVGAITGYEKFAYTTDTGATFNGDGFSFGTYMAKHLGAASRFDAEAIGTLLNYNLAAGAFTGQLGAQRVVLAGGFAHRIDLGGLIFEPNLRVNGVWEWQNSYTDTATVFHAARSFNYERLTGGAKLSRAFKLDEGRVLTPYVSLNGDYRITNSDLAVDHGLDGLSARIGLGANLRMPSGTTVGIDGELTGIGFSSGELGKSLKAQVSIPF